MIEAGYYFVYPVNDEIIILKDPNKYKLAKLNDSIEELVTSHIIHPSLAKLTKLMADNPTLTFDILNKMNKEVLIPDYSEFTITEKEDKRDEKDNGISSIEFDFS